MATKVLPLATSGGCNCCPKWIVDCCPYRKCGLPSTLLATTSEGSYQLLTTDGELWVGTFPMFKENSAQVYFVRLTLKCDADEGWKMLFYVSAGGSFLPGDDLGIWERAIVSDCSTFKLSFLFTDIEIINYGFLRDVAITVTLPGLNTCKSCCCYATPRLDPVGLFNDDCYDCVGSVLARQDFVEAQDISGGTCIWSTGGLFLLGVECLCAEPTPDDGSIMSYILFYQFDGVHCVPTVACLHYWTCGLVPYLQEVARYQTTLENCRDTGSGSMTLDRISGTSQCQFPDSITIVA